MKARVVVKAGLLKPWYDYHKLSRVRAPVITSSLLEMKESLGISVDVGMKGGIFLRKINRRPNNKHPHKLI
jgi:hypothetical protein